MRGHHKHLNDEDEEEEKEEDDVYMYMVDMSPDKRAEFRAACHVSKASE